MTIVKEHFDDLGFMQSEIDKYMFANDKLTVYINSGLDIFPNHPLCNSHRSSEPCILTFENVKLYMLEIYEYKDSTAQDFKGKKIVKNDFSNLKSDNAHYEQYSFEGVLKHPFAWISGDIFAASFYLDDLK